MPVTFVKATKWQSKLRLAIIGPSGSGKTYSALSIATAIGGRIALIDTEHGSAGKYAGRFTFDTVTLSSFAPERYMEAIAAAEEAEYDVLIIDSISHAWAGKDGILEFVDQQKLKGGADPTGWGKATPRQNAFVERILSAGEHRHIIVTMRSKMTIVLDKDEQTHQTKVRRIGMQPIQRDMLEYEFDLVGDMDQDNTFTVTKTRFEDLPIGRTFDKPGKQLADILMADLADGSPKPPPPPKPEAAEKQQAETEQADKKATGKAPAAEKAKAAAQQAAALPALRFTPDNLKEAIEKTAAVHTRQNDSAKDEQHTTCASLLELCFAGEPKGKEMRDQVALWLTGVATMPEIPGVKILALLDWLKPVVDSGGHAKPDAMAVREAAEVWKKIAASSQDAVDEALQYFSGTAEKPAQEDQSC